MPREDFTPTLWGGAGWTFLEYCARGLDEQSVPLFHDFLRLLPGVLPCASCRKETEEYIRVNPLCDREPLDWVLRFRAAVAARVRAELRPCGAYAWLAVGLAALLLLSVLLCAMRRR